MSIGTGIVYLVLALIGPRLLARSVSPIISSVPVFGFALYKFPLWFGLLITSICFAMYFGSPTTPEEVIDAPAFNRRYGSLFDMASNILLLISIALLVKSFFS